jgi:hypothetical protein
MNTDRSTQARFLPGIPPNRATCRLAVNFFPPSNAAPAIPLPDASSPPRQIKVAWSRAESERLIPILVSKLRSQRFRLNLGTPSGQEPQDLKRPTRG